MSSSPTPAFNWNLKKSPGVYTHGALSRLLEFTEGVENALGNKFMHAFSPCAFGQVEKRIRRCVHMWIEMDPEQKQSKGF